MNDFPNFPLLFDQIANYLARAKWSAHHEEQLRKLGMPAESIKMLDAYFTVALNEYNDVAQDALDSITRSIYGKAPMIVCSAYPRIPK